MTILDTFMQFDWTRAVRVWILVAAGLAAWESAYLLRRAVFRLREGADDAR